MQVNGIKFFVKYFFLSSQEDILPPPPPPPLFKGRGRESGKHRSAASHVCPDQGLYMPGPGTEPQPFGCEMMLRPAGPHRPGQPDVPYAPCCAVPGVFVIPNIAPAAFHYLPTARSRRSTSCHCGFDRSRPLTGVGSYDICLSWSDSFHFLAQCFQSSSMW